MAVPASSTRVECAKCFHSFKTRAKSGARIVCPMCESFFHVEQPADASKPRPEDDQKAGRTASAEPGKKAGDRPDRTSDEEEPPARDTETQDENASDQDPIRDESWTDGEGPDEQADWDDEDDLQEQPGPGLPQGPAADGAGGPALPTPSPVRSPPVARQKRLEPDNLADGALTLARDVTKPYRHANLFQLARQPATKVQIAALLLMVVFFLGLFTTVTYAWLGYAWDDPTGGEGPNSLQITVQNDTGTELKNAQVRIEALSIHVESNDHGLVVLHKLPSGDHEVLISKQGFNPVRLLVTLRSSTDTQKTVSLEEGEGKETVTLDFRESTDLPSAGMLYLLAIIFLLGSLAAFLAASFSFQRIRYRMSMGCAVAAILSYGFLLGSLLSFVALFLLILAPYEFQGQTGEARLPDETDLASA